MMTAARVLSALSATSGSSVVRSLISPVAASVAVSGLAPCRRRGFASASAVGDDLVVQRLEGEDQGIVIVGFNRPAV